MAIERMPPCLRRALGAWRPFVVETESSTNGIERDGPERSFGLRGYGVPLPLPTIDQRHSSTVLVTLLNLIIGKLARYLRDCIAVGRDFAEILHFYDVIFEQVLSA